MSKKYLSNENPLRIEYASGIAASGKTTFIIDTVARNPDCFTIIVKPTIEMCETTAKKIKKSNKSMSVHIIHSEDGDNSNTVACRISNLTDRMVSLGEPGVILCTHQAFLKVPLFVGIDQWTVYWDEEFDPTTHIDRKFTPEEQQAYIFDGCSFEFDSDNYDFLKVQNEARDRIISRIQLNVDSNDPYRSAFDVLLDTHAQKTVTYVHKEYLNTNRLVLSAVRTPDIFKGFKKVVFFGARFEQSLLYAIWERVFDVEWIACCEWTRHCTKHRIKKTHEQAVEFHYAVEGAKHTQHTNKIIAVEFLKGCSSVLDKPSTLFLGNKHQEKLKSNAVNLPWGCYGLDTFKHCDSLVYLGAFNKTNPYYTWLNSLKLNSNFPAHHFYQSIMRSALRDPAYPGPMKVYTPCLDLVNQVIDVFPNATIHRMPCGDSCENLLYEADGRHTVKEDDGRRKKIELTEEFYIKKNAYLANTVPDHILHNKFSLVEWFKERGYELREVSYEKTYGNRTKRMITVQVFCQFPDSHKKALVLLKNR